MKLLILGGTVFAGRHMTQAALERGHDITLFNRGKSNPGAFEAVRQIHGDRDADLGALGADETWDAVIDMCGYKPRSVRASAEFLKNRVQRYAFISTLSVYVEYGRANSEGDEVVKLRDEFTEEVTPQSYGGLKVMCEMMLNSIFRQRSLVIRPGLIAGPCDSSDRFTYWVRRLAQGGEVLAPGKPTRKVQWIDARDLAEFTLHTLEANLGGTYNTVGPRQPITMRKLLEACKAVSGGNAAFTWLPDEFLTDRNVRAYTELPLWVPEYDDQFDSSKAFAAGLKCRPVETTIKDTLLWDRARNGAALKAGLTPQREAELLAEWNKQKTA